MSSLSGKLQSPFLSQREAPALPQHPPAPAVVPPTSVSPPSPVTPDSPVLSYSPVLSHSPTFSPTPAETEDSPVQAAGKTHHLFSLIINKKQTELCLVLSVGSHECISYWTYYFHDTCWTILYCWSYNCIAPHIYHTMPCSRVIQFYYIIYDILHYISLLIQAQTTTNTTLCLYTGCRVILN